MKISLLFLVLLFIGISSARFVRFLDALNSSPIDIETDNNITVPSLAFAQVTQFFDIGNTTTVSFRVFTTTPNKTQLLSTSVPTTGDGLFFTIVILNDTTGVITANVFFESETTNATGFVNGSSLIRVGNLVPSSVLSMHEITNGLESLIFDNVGFDQMTSFAVFNSSTSGFRIQFADGFNISVNGPFAANSLFTVVVFFNGTAAQLSNSSNSTTNVTDRFALVLFDRSLFPSNQTVTSGIVTSGQITSGHQISGQITSGHISTGVVTSGQFFTTGSIVNFVSGASKFSASAIFISLAAAIVFFC